MCMTEKKKEEEEAATSSASDVWDKSQIRSKPEFPLCFQPLTPQLGLTRQMSLRKTLIFIFSLVAAV